MSNVGALTVAPAMTASGALALHGPRQHPSTGMTIALACASGLRRGLNLCL